MSDAWVVVVAAGRGERLQRGVPKAWVPLEGRPLVAYCLEAAAASPEVGSLLGVGDAGSFEGILPALSPEAREKWRGAVAGGETRQASSRAGLIAVRERAQGNPVVLVHDGARPLAPPSLFGAVARAAEEGPALAATPVTDTVKLVTASTATKTLDRSRMALAQTPQGARLEIFLAAHLASPDEDATDDATLFESGGTPVAVVAGPRTNIKVTTEDDFRLVETLLRAGGAPWMPAAVAATRPAAGRA